MIGSGLEEALLGAGFSRGPRKLTASPAELGRETFSRSSADGRSGSISRPCSLYDRSPSQREPPSSFWGLPSPCSPRWRSARPPASPRRRSRSNRPSSLRTGGLRLRPAAAQLGLDADVPRSCATSARKPSRSARGEISGPGSGAFSTGYSNCYGTSCSPANPARRRSTSVPTTRWNTTRSSASTSVPTRSAPT